MSFIWRSSGVAITVTDPGLCDTGLLVIRIFMMVVLRIGVLYCSLILITFNRYGVVMDTKWKLWKHHINEWIDEITTGNKGLFVQPALDDLLYLLSHFSFPDCSSYYYPSPYYCHSYSDVNDKHPQNINSCPATIVVHSPQRSPSKAKNTSRPGHNQPEH
jgi:hypothetical protein